MATLLGEVLFGDGLTTRELDVLSGVADGETHLETADRLNLSGETIKSYRKRIIAKLGARNCTHAACMALRRGIID